MRVMIIGGGISGLTLALSLHQAGIPAKVYEAASAVGPLGVGINLQPNAVRELTELGLAEHLAATGIATEALSFFNKHGQLIWSEPRGRAAGFRWPQYSIHRGFLQMLLLAETRKRIGEANVVFRRRLVSFAERGGQVIARFAESDDGPVVAEERGDVLVGADGIHSAVRRQLYPREGAPHFNDQLLWRAAVDTEPFLGGATMAIAGHFHQRVVVYPIAPSRRNPGQIFTNWIVQKTVDRSMAVGEDWSRRVGKERFFDAIQDWRFPWLDVPALVEKTEEIFEFPLVDRHPVARWSFGRVTLIGDAAHPMQPTGSQAGSQAVVDARMLTRALMNDRDPVAALAAYDAERRPAMNEVVLRNRQFGPEAAMQIVEERAPDGFVHVEDVISRDEMERISKSFQVAAGLDAEFVNNRPSFVVPR